MSRLNNIIETLKALDKINKTLKAKTIDQKLTEMEFYDRQQEIFKPITNEIKKQTEQSEDNINQLKLSIENNKNNLNEITFPGLENIEKKRANNSFFNPISTTTNNTTLFGINSQVQLELDSIKNEVKTLNTGKIFQITDGVNQLLTVKDFDINSITKEDFETYLQIYVELKQNPGRSERIKNLRKKFPEISMKYPMKKFGGFLLEKQPTSLSLGVSNDSKAITPSVYDNQPIIIPESIDKIKKRLQVLLAAKSQGHTNVRTEILSLLDILLEKKLIDKKEYLKLAN